MYALRVKPTKMLCITSHLHILLRILRIPCLISKISYLMQIESGNVRYKCQNIHETLYPTLPEVVNAKMALRPFIYTYTTNINIRITQTYFCHQ